jgi:hypothetical protein
LGGRLSFGSAGTPDSGIERLIRSIWNMGFDAIRWLWRYFLLGAVIVIPIWFIMRMVNTPRGR